MSYSDQALEADDAVDSIKHKSSQCVAKVHFLLSIKPKALAQKLCAHVSE